MREDKTLKIAQYKAIYEHIIELFNPRDNEERKMIVKARAVIYRLQVLKGDALMEYVEQLETEICNNFIKGVSL